jgi:hypothetical protein
VNLFNCYYLPAVGAAYGTAKAGIGITGMGTQRPDLIMKVGRANASEMLVHEDH